MPVSDGCDDPDASDARMRSVSEALHCFYLANHHEVLDGRIVRVFDDAEQPMGDDHVSRTLFHSRVESGQEDNE